MRALFTTTAGTGRQQLFHALIIHSDGHPFAVSSTNATPADELVSKILTEDFTVIRMVSEKVVCWQRVPGQEDPQKRVVFFATATAHKNYGASRDSWFRKLQRGLHLEFVHQGDVFADLDFWTTQLKWLSSSLGIGTVEPYIQRLPNSQTKGGRGRRGSSSRRIRRDDVEDDFDDEDEPQEDDDGEEEEEEEDNAITVTSTSTPPYEDTSVHFNIPSTSLLRPILSPPTPVKSTPYGRNIMSIASLLSPEDEY